MKTKAQSLLEYLIVLGAIAFALSTMGLYLRRGIQRVVKIAADEMGDVKQGAVDRDSSLEWKEKMGSDIESKVEANETRTTTETGEIIYDKYSSTITTPDSIASKGIYREK